MFRTAATIATILLAIATPIVPTATATPGEAVAETFYAAAHLTEVYMDAADDLGGESWPDEYSPNGDHVGPLPLNTTAMLATQLRQMGYGTGHNVDALLAGIGG